jgi:hypothetical protein
MIGIKGLKEKASMQGRQEAGAPQLLKDAPVLHPLILLSLNLFRYRKDGLWEPD